MSNINHQLLDNQETVTPNERLRKEVKKQIIVNKIKHYSQTIKDLNDKLSFNLFLIYIFLICELIIMLILDFTKH